VSQHASRDDCPPECPSRCLTNRGSSEPPLSVQPEALLDTYFTRFHAKPFFVLDESTLRQRLQLHQIPQYLAHAIYAVAAK
jgi:hypothetical protein